MFKFAEANVASWSSSTLKPYRSYTFVSGSGVGEGVAVGVGGGVEVGTGATVGAGGAAVATGSGTLVGSTVGTGTVVGSTSLLGAVVGAGACVGSTGFSVGTAAAFPVAEAEVAAGAGEAPPGEQPTTTNISNEAIKPNAMELLDGLIDKTFNTNTHFILRPSRERRSVVLYSNGTQIITDAGRTSDSTEI